jgi:hypothetical protein
MSRRKEHEDDKLCPSRSISEVQSFDIAHEEKDAKPRPFFHTMKSVLSIIK